ncbi:hypothetical protein D9M68_932690 [compost metagenome]
MGDMVARRGDVGCRRMDNPVRERGEDLADAGCLHPDHGGTGFTGPLVMPPRGVTPQAARGVPFVRGDGYFFMLQVLKPSSA